MANPPEISGAGQTSSYDRIDLQTDEGRQYIRNYILSPKPTMGGERGTPAAPIYDTAELERRVDDIIGNARFMYVQGQQAVTGTGEFLDTSGLQLGIIMSYDGTPAGDVNNIQELLQGMRLDGQWLSQALTNVGFQDRNTGTANLASIKGQLAAAGYYNVLEGGAASVEYGSYATEEDDFVFRNFVQDLINENLRIGDLQRQGQQVAAPSVEQFILDRTVANFESERTLHGSRPTGSTQEDLSVVAESVLSSMTRSGSGFSSGASLKVQQTINQLHADGEIDLDFSNEAFMTGGAGDDEIANADAFLSQFYGGGENWIDSIEIGTANSSREWMQMAVRAGILDPNEGISRIDATSGRRGDWMQSLSDEDKRDIARFGYITSARNAGTDDAAAANLFANTFGERTFTQNGRESSWLDQVMADYRTTGQLVGSQTTATLLGDDIAALETAETRALAAMGVDLGSSTNTRVLNDMLQAIGGNTGQRTSRL